MKKSLSIEIIAGIIGGLVALVTLLMWLRLSPVAILVSEPCAPGHPVIVNGKKVGCTNDKPSKDGWYPGIER